MDEDILAEVREKLAQLVAAYDEEDDPYTYGFVLHPREHAGDLRFGIITLGGESLMLSRTLLDALLDDVCWIYGAVPVQLRAPSPGPPGSDGAALSLFIHHLDESARSPELAGLLPGEGPVTPETLREPLLALTHARPEGWPP